MRLFFVAAMAGATALAGTAEARPLLLPLSLGADDYGESYSFIADLEDKTYVLLQLGISNVGPGAGHGICRGLVVSPTGATWTDNKIVDSGEWGHQTGPGGERLKVGPCTLTVGADGTVITIPLDDSKVSLAFAQKPTVVRAPGARIPIGKNQHIQEIWLGAAPVVATIALEDVAPRTVKGIGYGDHAVSDADPAKIATRWIRFRALRVEPPVLIHGREAPGGAQGPNWIRRGDAFETLAKVEATRTGKTKDTRFSVKAGDLSITSDAFVYRYAPIEDLGVVGNVLSPFVGSPVSYTLRATLTDGDKKIPGLLEIELASE